MARSISAASRTRPSYLHPEPMAPQPRSRETGPHLWHARGIRMIATREVAGAISLSSSSHLPPIANSYSVGPVALPPGLARL